MPKKTGFYTFCYLYLLFFAFSSTPVTASKIQFHGTYTPAYRLLLSKDVVLAADFSTSCGSF